MPNPFPSTDTATWHLPHAQLRECHSPHLRHDEVLFAADPSPAHRLAWPTRPLRPDDPIAATRDTGPHRGLYYCSACRHRRGPRGAAWRTVTHAERGELPPCGARGWWPGCSGCGRPWPRSAFDAAAFFRSPGNTTGGGLLCPPCARTRPDGGWFEPSGVRRCPGGRAWYRLLRAEDPTLIGAASCIRCGEDLSAGAAPAWRLAPAPPDARPVPPGLIRYERLPALNGLVPPWPYLAHPWDLRDALAHTAPLLPHPDLYRGLRQGGPAWQQWYRRAENEAAAAAYRAGGTAEGPYACASCAACGLVEHARPLSLRELLQEGRPPATGIACYGCARPVVPERWHRAHDDIDPFQPDPHLPFRRCPGPHLRRDETLRPAGYLAFYDYAAATRPLRPDEPIGGAAERGETMQLLCLACYARARRSPLPHRPLTAAHRPTLSTGCDRCHRPWPLSALDDSK